MLSSRFTRLAANKRECKQTKKRNFFKSTCFLLDFIIPRFGEREHQKALFVLSAESIFVFYSFIVHGEMLC